MVDAAETETMPPFNDNRPLTVVQLPPAHAGGSVRLGVRDEATRRVWIEWDLHSSRVPDLDGLPVVALPGIPPQYGTWVSKSIGGVSKTERREGLLRILDRHVDPITLFAIRGASDGGVRCALDGNDRCTVGDTVHDSVEGFVNEVVVHHARDVSHIAALIARADAVPILEDGSLDAKRPLGIERLDRIGSKVVADSSNMVGESDDMYGPRRGTENWRFSWIPEDWEVPITWDHMVHNVRHVEDVKMLPFPLRRHVAEHRLRHGQHAPLGSQWEVSRPQPRDEAEVPWGMPSAQDVGHGIFAFNGARHRMRDPPARLVEALSDGILEFSEADVVPHLTPKTMVRARDGTWYNPVDPKKGLERCLLGKRKVSAALDRAQSRQLMDTFYLLTVETVPDPVVAKALGLIMFRYMTERGYTARWLGTYKQAGQHVGNGDTFRKFQRLNQYDPHRLPSSVLNKLCGNDGKLKNRGSKGSRSKYSQTQKERYFPKRRLKRTRDDEDAMVRG